ncbi:MAG: hypothetical protein RJB02_1370 [Pseudomonadota bacterium]
MDYSFQTQDPAVLGVECEPAIPPHLAPEC